MLPGIWYPRAFIEVPRPSEWASVLGADTEAEVHSGGLRPFYGVSPPMSPSPNGQEPESVASPSEGQDVRRPLDGERSIGPAGSNGNGASDDAISVGEITQGGDEASVGELSGRLRWTERERQSLLRKVEWLEERDKERKAVVENDRVRRHNHSLRVQVQALTEDCIRWRNCYENALHYLAILQPDLAEIAEDDLVQIWKANVS